MRLLEDHESEYHTEHSRRDSRPRPRLRGLACRQSFARDSRRKPLAERRRRRAELAGQPYLGRQDAENQRRGAGLNVKGRDQCHFVHVVPEAGDFEIVARLLDFTGEGEAAAGIMVRADSAPSGTMAALFFKPKENTVGWLSRVPNSSPQAKPRMYSGGIPLVRKPPLWLRMVRLGKNVAVYKSRDGRLWSMISNTSGGPIAIEGRIRLGLFVSSAAADKIAAATFDSIRIAPAHMPYKSSWVGNTFGCREDDQHVSNGLSAMWVAPDGTCYTSSYWDEAGRPVTSYHDGKVARALPIGTPQTAEGGIAGDGTHLYVATVDRITELDPASPDFAPRPLPLSINLLDKKAGHSVISGLAANGRELFVADARENVIRVAVLGPMKTYQVQTAANDGIVLAPALVVVPQGDPRFAPAAVYQTQRIGEGFRYTLPGFTPGATYTVRCHFAEYVTRPAKCDPRNRVRNVGSAVVNVAERAGGVLKPLVVDFPNYKADAQGNVVVDSGSYGGPGLCGLEVLDPAGKRLFAVNCGGPTAGEFQGECAERVDRQFPFERPGPMAHRQAGRSLDHPSWQRFSHRCRNHREVQGRRPVLQDRRLVQRPRDRRRGQPARPGLRRRERPASGGRERTGPERPLLWPTRQVAGAGQNVRPTGRHLRRETAGPDPRPGRRRLRPVRRHRGRGRGSRKAIFTSAAVSREPTSACSPPTAAAGGCSIASCSATPTTSIRPATARRLYGTYNHLRLDLSQTEPGKEQRYVGYNWDCRRFGPPERASSSQAIVRRLGPDRRLFMFTSGQGVIGDVNYLSLRRRDRHLRRRHPRPWQRAVDRRQRKWRGGAGGDYQDGLARRLDHRPVRRLAGRPVGGEHHDRRLVHASFQFQGINAAGVPVYGGLKGERL